ncbi:MAG: toll/interleukin-1 receptor domain-containing protein [Albidovulum sp.]|nr:toll/interleukin-1 receptor domain-containing protein [Albidovulum sp.]
MRNHRSSLSYSSCYCVVGHGNKASRSLSRFTQVFLSHSHADAPSAAKVASALSTRGLDVLDPDVQLLPSDNWAAGVARALDQSQAMVVLLTPQAVQSKHVMREMEFALGSKRYSHRLIPVFFGDRSQIPEHEIPWIVRRLPWFYLDETGGGDAEVERIASAIRSHS